MLRSVYLILTLFILSFSGEQPAYGQEFISGTILRINSEKPEILLGLKELSGGGSRYKQTVLIRPLQDNIFPKKEGRSVFPDCVIEGEQIRIWGDWEGGNRQVFLANDIRGCKGGGCSDPTGIMSRLKRHSSPHRKNMRHRGSGRGAGYRGGNR